MAGVTDSDPDVVLLDIHMPGMGGLDALPLIREPDHVLIGLPDTIWFPETALRELPDGKLSFLLFPVDRPELFDAVVTDEERRVREVQVKTPNAASSWIWGAFKMPGSVFHELHALWQERERQDEYMGTLVNAYLARGRGARRALVRGCGDAARLPRSDRVAERRAAARGKTDGRSTR